MEEVQPRPPATIFLSYAQKDLDLKLEFEDYLAVWQQNQLIAGWVERQVQRGTDWSQIIDPRLFEAYFVFLLLSPAFIASGYFSGAESREAFVRRDAGQARVIPIILYQVNLKGSPFEIIQSVPRNGIPISAWPERRKAWENVDSELSELIERYLSGWLR